MLAKNDVRRIASIAVGELYTAKVEHRKTGKLPQKRIFSGPRFEAAQQERLKMAATMEEFFRQEGRI